MTAVAGVNWGSVLQRKLHLMHNYIIAFCNKFAVSRRYNDDKFQLVLLANLQKQERFPSPQIGLR